MKKRFRLLLALLFTLLFSATAWADAPTEAPHDVAVAAGVIPPAPASYVTKSLGWLEFSYPPAASERVAGILHDADSVRSELARALGQPVLEHVVVRVAPTVSDMARLAPEGAPPPVYASGVAYHGLHLVLLSMLAPHGADAVDLDETFRHELAHVALEDATLGKHVPAWFNEGLAVMLSGEPGAARMLTLSEATLSGALIPLSELDRSMPRDGTKVSIAYAEAADFMRFLKRNSDQIRFVSMIERVRGGQSFERAVADAYGADLHRLEFEWRGELEHRFSVWPVLAGGGLVWILTLSVLVVAYVRRKRRANAVLARWEREEAAEEALRAAQLADESGEFTNVAALTTTTFRVEEDGRWHTLH